MRNVFNVRLDDYRVVTPEMLYGEFRDVIRNDPAITASSLYVISRIPKLRFVPDACRVGFNFNITGRMKIGRDREVTFNFSVPKFWHEHHLLSNAFESPAHLAAYYMRRVPLEGLAARMPGALKYKLSSCVVRELSSEERLVTECPITYGVSGGETTRLDILPHRAANVCDIDLGAYPEVLYVGISNKDTFKRIEKHSKLQRILAERGDHHDILIHFISIEDANVRLKTVGSLLMLANDSNHKLDKNDINEIAETVLINYFKPIYNRGS